MENFWLDFLTKQIPVIVVMGLGIIWQNKYFVKVVEKKDEIIEAKEDEIRQLNNKLLDVTEKCLTAFNRNAELWKDVKDIIIKEKNK